MRYSGLRLAIAGSRANDTPRSTPNTPKCRPIQPKRPFFAVFHPMGLHFGGHTTSRRGRATTNRGELRHPSLRHAGDTPQEGFAWRKTPTTVSLKCTSTPTRPGRSASRRENTRPAWPLQRPLRENTRPARPLQRLFREKTRPASTNTPNLGCFKRAGRTFSRFRDDTGPRGELFRAQMKPPPPLLTHSRAHMKPATPLLAHNASKTHIQGEQR